MEKEGIEEAVEVRDIEQEFNTEDAPVVEDAPVEDPKAPVEDAPVEDAPVEDEVLDKVDGSVKTWKDVGLEDFEGKSVEDIAKRIEQERRETDFREKKYGAQATELGELRKFREQVEHYPGRYQHSGDTTLHVTGTPPVYTPITYFSAKRWHVPITLICHRNNVDVSVEQNAGSSLRTIKSSYHVG